MKEKQCTTIISRAYIGMLLLLFLMMLTDIAEFGMANDFSGLNSDPGINGLWFIMILTILNVLMQMWISSFDFKWLKWLNLIFAVFYTLLMMGHQGIHLISGEGKDIHFFIDLTHHILGIWAVVYSYRWLKTS